MIMLSIVSFLSIVNLFITILQLIYLNFRVDIVKNYQYKQWRNDEKKINIILMEKVFNRDRSEKSPVCLKEEQKVFRKTLA